ncbi:MAG: hypothetical protein V4708_01600 [Bacteroidota bacterium]
MSLLSSKLQEQKVAYSKAKPYENGQLAPREGWYLIKEIRYQTIAGIEVPIAKALWTNDPKTFLDTSEIDVQLLSLYQSASMGPKHIDRDQLVGKVIKICASGLVEKSPGVSHRYWVQWKTTNLIIPVSTSQDLFFQSFISYEAFERSLTEQQRRDIETAQEYEAEESTWDENPTPDDLDGYDPDNEIPDGSDLD